MKNNSHTILARLIGKIDNDFNISESDWIPRVAAWVIDALSQMQILPMERKKRTLEVSDRLAQFPCKINATDIKVYDKNGCEIKELNTERKCCNSGLGINNVGSEIGVFNSKNKTGINAVDIATVVNSNNRFYVLDGNKFELSFDTDSIVVETYEIATYYDEYYNCQVPYLYDDGLLLEALAWYVLYKYLSRGSKHPVYDLNSKNPVTNPFTQWNTLRPKAMNSVKDKLSIDTNGWNNFFYNSTFLPRQN